jgi:hypothetical protein
MSEFYRPTQEKPEDKEAFEHELAEAASRAEVGRLIKNKAQEILSGLHKESQEELEFKIEEAINPQIKVQFEFNSNDSYLVIDKLKHDLPDLEETELLSIMLARIDEEISTIPNKLKVIEESAKFMKNSDDIKITLVNLQNELIMLRQQLEYKLNSQLELEGVSIQDALDQYRRFKSKLEGLSEDSPEQDDIRRVLNIYAEYIKHEFEQSPEKYAIGKSYPVGVDINKIVDYFVEPNDLTREQRQKQGDITEARQNITKELSQTPGVLGVIPMAGETEGSKNFDIIAITLKPNTNLSPEEINIALKFLYFQIQDSAKLRQDLIEDNRLDLGNIEIYTNGKPLADFTEHNQPDSELDPSQIFQLHPIKVAKRYSDVQYNEPYVEKSMAIARPSRDLSDYGNIPTLTDSYNSKDSKVKFNQARFQLSAQRALDLYLA